MLLELIRGAKKFTMFLSQGVFGRVDFRENRKKRRKNEKRENILRVFGWERGRENVWWDLGVFFLGLLESFFSKMGRKSFTFSFHFLLLLVVFFFFFSSWASFLLLFFSHLHHTYTIIFC